MSTWGIAVSHVCDRDGESYSLAGNGFTAKITLCPNRWLGICFEVLDPLGNRIISYDIDTDNYDISQAIHQPFLEEIEDEIVRLLDNLLQGNILIGNDRKGRPSVIIPSLDGFDLFQSKNFFGLSFESRKHLPSREELVAFVSLDQFRPLRVGEPG